MTTVHILYRDIPSYLHAGHFYRSLHSDDPESTIEVPADCFHLDGERAADLEEFRQLLRVMVFWMMDDIPLAIMDFCNRHELSTWKDSFTCLPGAVDVEVRPLLLTSYPDINKVPLWDIIGTDRWDLIRYAISKVAKSSSATAIAAELGNLSVLTYLHNDGFEWHEDTCWAASLTGQLACLEYSHENGCPWDRRVYICAVQGGHMNCLKYAHQQGLEWDIIVCKYAALSGHVECLQFAHENGCPWDVSITHLAAQEGHLQCLKYAHENGCPWDVGVHLLAAKYGYLRCVQYAFEQSLAWDAAVCVHAAAHGNGVYLLYALEHGCPSDENSSYSACMFDQLECLQVLHLFGSPWNEYTSCHASQQKELFCLQYLHENGCPWDEDTPQEASQRGLVAPLRYALERGCPCHGDIMEDAARSNSVECLQYVLEVQGLYMDEEVFKVALLRGDLACVQYLLDQSCPFQGATFDGNEEQVELYDEIFQQDNPEFVLCVQLVVERGWAPDKFFVEYVVARDELCKEWLKSEGFYVDDENATQLSKKGRSL